MRPTKIFEVNILIGRENPAHHLRMSINRKDGSLEIEEFRDGPEPVSNATIAWEDRDYLTWKAEGSCATLLLMGKPLHHFESCLLGFREFANKYQAYAKHGSFGCIIDQPVPDWAVEDLPDPQAEVVIESTTRTIRVRRLGNGPDQRLLICIKSTHPDFSDFREEVMLKRGSFLSMELSKNAREDDCDEQKFRMIYAATPAPAMDALRLSMTAEACEQLMDQIYNFEAGQ